MSAPLVASVLLVAAEPRQGLIAPWLCVVGQPVAYGLDVRAPEEVARLRRSWDVIVIDGESIPADDERANLLRRTSRHPHTFATVLFLFSRSPSDVEVRQAMAWADDVIRRGEELEDRLHRRVQAIALAPWRRASGLRLEDARRDDDKRPDSERP